VLPRTRGGLARLRYTREEPKGGGTVAITASDWEVEELPTPPRLRLVVPRHDLPLVSKRTCAKCGEFATFVRDGNGSWYTCCICGRYA
jgi:hypothetical protein